MKLRPFKLGLLVLALLLGGAMLETLLLDTATPQFTETGNNSDEASRNEPKMNY